MDGPSDAVSGAEICLEDLKVVCSGLSVLSEEADASFSADGKDFDIKSLLGEGSFGSVYRCSLTRSADGEDIGTEFAVKIISASRVSILTGCPHQALLERLLREAELLRRLGGHPNILGLHLVSVSLQSLRLFVVMELVPGGDLFTFVVNRRKPMSEKEARVVARQLVSAVAHCHSHGIAHRDIKLENILVASAEPFQLKLGDFGSAALAQETTVAGLKSTAKTLTTTERYTPPEVVRALHNNLPYNMFKVDAFGVGIVVYVIVCNAFPDAAKSKAFETHPRFCQLSLDAKDFVLRLLCQDPDRRMGVGACEEHPFLHQPLSCQSTPTSKSPVSLDAELQGLLAAQALVKSMQRQRGASCWAAASSEGLMEYTWRCQSTAQRLELARARLAELEGESWDGLRAAVKGAAEVSVRLSQRVATVLKGDAQEEGEGLFEDLFCGYGRVLQTMIEDLGACISAILRPLWHQGELRCAEFRLKLLLLICEQLGRERAFVAGHINSPERLQSLSVRLRFAKIQGARQMLLGNSSPRSSYDVVSFAGGLLPSFFLMKEPLLTDKEIADLEEAELHVFEGKKGSSEWWSLITKMIDTAHARISLGMIAAVHQAVIAHQGGTRSPPTLSGDPIDVA